MALPPSAIRYQEEHIQENKKPNLIAASVICLSVAYIAVLLRFASRRAARTVLEADDYTIVLGLFFTSVFVAMVLVDMHYGLGRHLILVTDGVAFGKGILAAEILYNPAIATTKFAILLLYRRLFPVRIFCIVLWSVGAFVAAYSTTAAMVNLLQCLPIRAVWNPAVTPRCVNLGVELIILSSINVVTDVAILCLPMPLVWRLQTSRTRKAQVSGMFLLGGFVCIVSIIRATYVSNVSLTDGSWADADSAIWSVVETCIAVVSACLPTLNPLFNKRVRARNNNNNNATSRNRYESYTLKKSGGSSTTRKSPWSQNDSSRLEDDEERVLGRMSNP